MSSFAPLIVIADRNASHQALIEGALARLKPRPEFIRVESIEQLFSMLHDRTVDMVCLEINFGEEAWVNCEGLDAVPALVRMQPRVPMILASHELNVQRVQDAFRDNPPMRAVLDKGLEDFATEIRVAAREAIQWGKDQRFRANSLFQQGLDFQAANDPVDAARYMIEAHHAGDMSRENLDRFQPILDAMLPHIQGFPALLADSLWALLHHCFNRNDEMGVIFYANRLIARFPKYEHDAREYLLVSSDVGKSRYAVIDVRLELARAYRRRGEHQKVLIECESIQNVLGNVVESYAYQVEALRSLGRTDDAIETAFSLLELLLSNGELDRVRLALREITLMDRDKKYFTRVERVQDRISQIATSLAATESPQHYPHLWVCGRSDCLQAAQESNGFYMVKEDLAENQCSICGTVVRGQIGALSGKKIVVIGGRFGSRYIDAIKALGASEVAWHDAQNDLDVIPDLIEQSDGVILVAPRSTPAGIIKAEHALQVTGRPEARTIFYGVKQVVGSLVWDLLPKLVEQGPELASAES